MIYVIVHGSHAVATLKAWDGTVTHAVQDKGRYQWTVGKKIAVVLEWMRKHEHQWEVRTENQRLPHAILKYV